MAAADVRDMLDLPAEGQPRPHKKQKVVEKRPGWYSPQLRGCFVWFLIL